MGTQPLPNCVPLHCPHIAPVSLIQFPTSTLSGHCTLRRLVRRRSNPLSKHRPAIPSLCAHGRSTEAAHQCLPHQQWRRQQCHTIHYQPARPRLGPSPCRRRHHPATLFPRPSTCDRSIEAAHQYLMHHQLRRQQCHTTHYPPARFRLGPSLYPRLWFRTRHRTPIQPQISMPLFPVYHTQQRLHPRPTLPGALVPRACRPGASSGPTHPLAVHQRNLPRG